MKQAHNPKPGSDEFDRELLQALLHHLEKLKAMSEKYPVFFIFNGTGFRFEKPSDIDDLIADLRAKPGI